MRLRDSCHALGLLLIGLSTTTSIGCGSDGRKLPTAPATTPAPAPTPAPPPPMARYHVTGTVMDENGLPVAGATVLLYDGPFKSVETATNGAGHYEADLEVPEVYQTMASVGVVEAWRGDEFEDHAQSIPSGPGAIVNVARNLRLRRFRTIDAGQSMTVSIEPDSSLDYDSEWSTGLNRLREDLHVRVDAAGVLTVEARPEAGGTLPSLSVNCVSLVRDNCEFNWVNAPLGSNSGSLRVKANSVLKISVAIPTYLAPHRFVVSTSLAQ